ncbi:MAG: hypothetical protein GY828_04735 [Candidatus Gracilibacteria bacterium]|nr:hypothetical protein [Candidatus Gracilibacteria bacterium]
MKSIKLRDKKLQEEYDYIIEKYYFDIPDEYAIFVKMVIMNFKRYSNDEDYIVFMVVYGLIFMKKLDINDPDVKESYKIKSKQLLRILQCEINGDPVGFLNSIYEIDDELFNLRMIIKYSVLIFERRNKQMIISSDEMKKKHYLKFIGYIIPYLTFKESKFLSFFQDIYFEYMYSEEYIDTKIRYIEKMKKTGLAGEYVINVVNHLSEVMIEGKITSIMKVRKKSFFSIFNKIKRKQDLNFTDSIGVRLIFNNDEDLDKYKKLFEEKFIYTKKKDYISKPKENGYQSLHYSFVTLHENNEIYVELQLRTIAMENNIKKTRGISHYTYTVKKNKWDTLFTEVQFGHYHLTEYIKIKKDSVKRPHS